MYPTPVGRRGTRVEERSSVAEVRRALTELRAGGPLPPVLETVEFDPAAGAADRFELPPGPADGSEVGLAPESWLLTTAREAVGRLWPFLAGGLGAGGPGPRVLARFDPKSPVPPVADLAAFGALPRCRVAVPSDTRSTAAVLAALRAEPTPAYVRIPTGWGDPVGAPTFGWAAAPILEEGADLTVVGVGPVLAEVRALRERLKAVGVSARILDGTSVKPIDAATIVRAARETGAILVAEQHHALTGYGGAVAALTALAYPIPVRRVGYPDLPAGVPTEGAPGGVEYGPTPARLDEEAWELLKARGKVQ